MATLADDLSRLDNWCLRQRSDDRSTKRGAAFTAKLRDRSIPGTALRAAPGKSGSAFRAELPAFWIFKRTARTAHESLFD
jgi:hypothetical protein